MSIEIRVLSRKNGDGDKMDYYSKVAKASYDVSNWVVDDNRPKWDSFTRSMLQKYGFSPKKIRQLLETMYPRLTVDTEENVLIRKDELNQVSA